MLKHHLTQFDKTLTLKLYIKIAYKKHSSIQTPPPFHYKNKQKSHFAKTWKMF